VIGQALREFIQRQPQGMATRKQEEIKVRVTRAMKAQIVALANARGESESIIVREALFEYLQP